VRLPPRSTLFPYRRSSDLVAPEVISGDEEARLSFTGAVATLPDLDGQRLLVDIGGGSTEFVRGRDSEVLAAISVDVGCVRMTERSEEHTSELQSRENLVCR